MGNVPVMIKMPKHLKDAAEVEAARRGISLSALVKNYLSNFLPKNIDASIKKMEVETAEK